MRRRSFPLALLLVALAVVDARAQSPNGVPIVVEVAAGVTMAQAARGAQPALHVAKPVVVDGDTLIDVGTPVYAKLSAIGALDEASLSLDSTRTRRGAIVPIGAVYELPAGTKVLARCEQLAARVTIPFVTPVASRTPLPLGIAACEPEEGPYRRKATKNVWAAMGLAYAYPGLGHIYAGEKRRGAVLIATTVISSVFIISELDDEASHTDSTHAATLGWIGLAGVLGSYVYSLVDAPSAVHRYNERMLIDPKTMPPGFDRTGPAPRMVRPYLRMMPSPRPGNQHASAPSIGVRIR